MNQQPRKGISRQGLNASFDLEESYKSNLLLQAALLREQGQEEAATRFAEAAAIEERLGETCVEQGLKENPLCIGLAQQVAGHRPEISIMRSSSVMSFLWIRAYRSACADAFRTMQIRYARGVVNGMRRW